MSNFYSEAIEIISDKDADFRALVIEIAKTQPSIIVKASAALANKDSENWQDAVRRILNEQGIGGKIEAIKACRNLSGMDLKTAKGAVEAMM